jgi:hypothetical protein
MKHGNEQLHKWGSPYQTVGVTNSKTMSTVSKSQERNSDESSKIDSAQNLDDRRRSESRVSINGGESTSILIRAS